MEKNPKCIKSYNQDIITMGVPVKDVYKEIHEILQEYITEREDTYENFKKKSKDKLKKKKTKNRNSSDLSDIVEIHDLEKYNYPRDVKLISVIRKFCRKKENYVNYGVFTTEEDFVQALSTFIVELAEISENLTVNINSVNIQKFINYILQCFSVTGNLATLKSHLIPKKKSILTKSGLTEESIFNTVFLFQSLGKELKPYLAFNIVMEMLYFDMPYVNELLDSIYKETCINILTSVGFGAPFEGIAVQESLNNMASEFLRVKILVNGLYLLHDIYNEDEETLKKIFHTLLIFALNESTHCPIKIIGLNDLFICTVIYVAGEKIMINNLMIACRDKLMMSYKANSIGLSIRYIYTTLYLPLLSKISPESFIYNTCFSYSSKNCLVNNSILENETTVKNNFFPTAYRKGNTKFKSKTSVIFKSKQKLSFDD